MPPYCCDRQESTLNLVAAESQSAQTAMVQLARTQERETTTLLDRLPTLALAGHHAIQAGDLDPRYLNKILLRTYEEAPRDFEQLLGIPGVGPKTLRALALVAELIYGTPASTRDPARFAFAHGGKDRIPTPSIKIPTNRQSQSCSGPCSEPGCHIQTKSER